VEVAFGKNAKHSEMAGIVNPGRVALARNQALTLRWTPADLTKGARQMMINANAAQFRIAGFFGVLTD
jgi:hypothetical protein